MYLIQRGKFRNNIEGKTALLGCRDHCLVNPDYMGSAEFEWGAIPHAYVRIMANIDQYELFVSDELKPVSGVPFCVFCKKNEYENIIKGIRKLADGKGNTKERHNLEYQFSEPTKSEYSIDEYKYGRQTNFWWCIDRDERGDWIAFTGASDRQNAFKRVIKSDYNEAWVPLPYEDKKKRIEESTRW